MSSTLSVVLSYMRWNIWLYWHTRLWIIPRVLRYFWTHTSHKVYVLLNEILRVCVSASVAGEVQIVCVSHLCDNSDSHPTKSRLEFSIQVLLQTRCRSELTTLHGTKLYDDNKIWHVFYTFNTSTAERVGSSNDGPEFSSEDSAFRIFAASLADHITDECFSPRSCLYCLWSGWKCSVPSAEYPVYPVCWLSTPHANYRFKGQWSLYVPPI